jgi:hypothetical protein
MPSKTNTNESSLGFSLSTFITSRVGLSHFNCRAVRCFGRKLYEASANEAVSSTAIWVRPTWG